MAEIINFSDFTKCKSCKDCKHLLYTDAKTAYCTARDYTDGTHIYPIQDGKKSEDWDACNGEGFERKLKRKSSQYGRNII